jgi:hypothetical protein
MSALVMVLVFPSMARVLSHDPPSLVDRGIRALPIALLEVAGGGRELMLMPSCSGMRILLPAVSFVERVLMKSVELREVLLIFGLVAV